MKPGKPLVRRTPLQSRKPFESRCELQRRTQLAPVSDKRAKLNRQRTVIVNGLREAQQGRCARCHAVDVLDGHELRGGSFRHQSILDPRCALCRPCNGWAECEPILAAWSGWKVSGKHPHDPALNIGEAWDVDGDRVVFADLALAADGGQ